MSLLIGNHIFSVLTLDEDVKLIVDDRIFPIIIPEQTKKSFIMYDEISVVGEYTKDGLIGDVTFVSVKCVSERFEAVSILADNVRQVLESTSMQYDGYSIEGSYLKNSNVGYDSGLYVFVLNFEFQTTY